MTNTLHLWLFWAAFFGGMFGGIVGSCIVAVVVEHHMLRREKMAPW